jgi:hypothetical protein
MGKKASVSKVSEKVLFLKQESQSQNLFTKEQGQQIYDRIRTQLKELPCPGLLVLDFMEIQYIVPTCLSQILKIFHERHQEEFSDKYLLVRLEKTNSDLKECLRLVAKEESLVLLCGNNRGDWELLGHLGQLTQALKSTLELVQKLGIATSKRVSEELGLRLSAASNRLRQLYEMRLLVRDEESLPATGGRRFVYSFVLSYPFKG